MLVANTDFRRRDRLDRREARRWPDPAPGQEAARREDDARVLIVSTSERTREDLEAKLVAGGFSCQPAGGAAEARMWLQRETFGLIVLEGRLEGGGALTFCQYLASHVPCPVIMVDGGADVMDRIIALEVGADDYLSHPVHDRELLARARALVRRQRIGAETGEPRPAANRPTARWSLNLISRLLIGPGGGRSTLTPQEQSLLAAFLSRPGEPLTPDTVGATPEGKSLSVIHFRTYVVRLRKKLSEAGFPDDAIRTLRFAGYVFDPDVAASGVVS